MWFEEYTNTFPETNVVLKIDQYFPWKMVVGRLYPGMPTTIKRMDVNITTIAYTQGF